MGDLHARLVAALTARLEVARAECAVVEAALAWRAHVASMAFHGNLTGPEFTLYDAAGALDDADNDPAAEIRRVEALLRVVERHRPIAVPPDRETCDACFDAGQMGYPCPDIRDLAAGEGIEP